MVTHPDFRITCNGFEYRVEQRSFTFWTKNEVWTPIKTTDRYGLVAEVFETRKEAQERLNRVLLVRARYIGDWAPIK